MNDTRDRLLQDLLDGQPHAGQTLDAAARRELAAYKLVYRELGSEPPSYLPPDFAQRVAAAAFARDESPWLFWLLTGLLVLFGIAVSAVVLAIALPPDSVVRSLFRGLSLRSLDLAPVLNASSVLLTFGVAFALDRWLERER